jgi:hypothetical protein
MSVFSRGEEIRMIPCTITSVSPLLVTMQGTPNIPGVRIPGVTYSLGAANALQPKVGQPTILPIG